MVSLGNAKFTNTEFVTEFIELYKIHTCLWQVKSPDYLNRDKRVVAYQSLVDLCRKIDNECDVKFVKKKIANLRNAFRKEHAKVQSSKKSGFCNHLGCFPSILSKVLYGNMCLCLYTILLPKMISFVFLVSLLHISPMQQMLYVCRDP